MLIHNNVRLFIFVTDGLPYDRLPYGTEVPRRMRIRRNAPAQVRQPVKDVKRIYSLHVDFKK